MSLGVAIMTPEEGQGTNFAYPYAAFLVIVEFVLFA